MAKARAAKQGQPTRLFALICASCGVGVLLVVVVAPLAWAPAAIFSRLELSYDAMVVGLGKKSPVRDDLLFVGIDDISTNLLESGVMGEEEIALSEALDLMSYGYPFPRQVWGMLAERLLDAGARVVVFDLLFTSRGEGDELLRRALDRYPGRVVVGAELVYRQEQQSGGTWSLREPVTEILSPGGAEDPRQGYVNFSPFADGRVWQASFRTALGDWEGAPEYRSLGAAALHQAGYGERVPEEAAIGIRFTDMFPRQGLYERIFGSGSDSKRGLFARLFDPGELPKPYQPLPLYTIFDDEYWTRNYRGGEMFRDKIVVVGGSSLVRFRDVVETPVGEIGGPQLHINTIATVLNGDHYRFASPWAVGGLVVLAAQGAFWIALLFRRPIIGLLLLLGVACLYVAVTVWVYNAGLMLAGVAPLGTLLLSGMLCFGAQYTLERLEKQRLKRALDRYFSKDLTDEILARPGDFLDSMGGRRTNVTVLFSDLRDFTAKSENADERELVTQLNEYLEEMVACVFENGGMVDKFIGDAVMAVWGAVRSGGDAEDAEGAVRAAMAMRERLAKLNEKWAAEGRQTHAFGVGINQGPAVFGNIGSLAKMELTVIGDAVNLASRLEGLTKRFGVDLLVSGSVAGAVADTVLLQPIDRVVPKGKSEAVDIFAVPAWEEADLDPGEAEYLKLYHEAHQAWCDADPSRAEELFRRCAELRPEDKTVALYLSRLEADSSAEAMRDPLRLHEK